MTASVLPPRFVRLELIASGGMGEVYRATDSVLGRVVAVKVLAERHSRDLDIRERFTREARAAARLSAHPNVVTVYDVGAHQGRPYIVMEYVSGGSVQDRIRAGRIAPARALGWLEEAARGLDAAHASGIVHRDVKPANLLLDDDDHVHVTDFGIASAAGFDTLTLPGTVLGTAGYLAPEQARGEPTTAASDRYGLGVVAFELLTGRRPFASDTAVTEAFAHMHQDVPSARSLAPALPPGVDAVLERALAKDPDERPATAAELVAELRAAFDEAEETTRVLAATAPPASRPVDARTAGSPFRRWPVAALAGIAILLAGGASAALLTSDDESPPARTVTRVRTVVTTVQDTASTLTVTETTTAEPDTENPPDTEDPPDVSGDPVALNDQGFRLMQAEDYDAALPLLEEAVAQLAGSGTITEAYASYNLAFTRFALGSCDGVIELLDRSEQVQGQRDEIDSLREQWAETCGGDEKSGRGNGRGRGNDD